MKLYIVAVIYIFISIMLCLLFLLNNNLGLEGMLYGYWFGIFLSAILLIDEFNED